MREHSWIIAGLVGALGAVAGAAEKEVLVEGLTAPESAIVTPDGRIFVTIIGKSGADGDGLVVEVKDGKAETFASGLNDPKGIGLYEKNLYVADKNKVWKISESGEATVYVDTDEFPKPPKFLNDLEVSPAGDVFVSDSGSFVKDGAVFQIKPDKTVRIVVDDTMAKGLRAPNGLLMDGDDHLLLADFMAQKLYRLAIADGALTELATGIGFADGIARDKNGTLFISDYRGGKVSVQKDASGPLEVWIDGFKTAADITYDAAHHRILVPDMNGGALFAVAIE